MSKTNENTDGTNLKIYSPMGHFLNWKLQLCFRPVPKIPIGTITLSHVMHLWLYSLYLHRWRSVYVGIVILFFCCYFVDVWNIFIYITKPNIMIQLGERDSKYREMSACNCWLEHPSTVSLNLILVGDDSHSAVVQCSQNEFSVCPHLCRYWNCQKEWKKRKAREEEGNMPKVTDWITGETTVLV